MGKIFGICLSISIEYQPLMQTKFISISKQNKVFDNRFKPFLENISI